MQVQYIYDESGRKTGVIVPIALWQEISRKNRGIKGNDPLIPPNLGESTATWQLISRRNSESCGRNGSGCETPPV
ncbi:MAG: hypothetical protein A4E38_00644 [Methanoregulaceae archaeon PtaB.Bin108]|nr:MAG: hypothetical protein A4E38_00644 [Methanoregulaceae archaeon PtaB.Bin108]OPY46305.1 MAG: hypothetical protein A4E42_00575 [Methanoregulaceae archaeon PtaU1.Bin222]